MIAKRYLAASPALRLWVAIIAVCVCVCVCVCVYMLKVPCEMEERAMAIASMRAEKDFCFATY